MAFSRKMSIAGLFILGCLAINFAAINSATIKPDVVPQCARDQHGNLTYPPNCKLFVECWYGEGLVVSCDHGQVFHSSKLICVPQAEVPTCEDGGFINTQMDTGRSQSG